MRTERNSTFLYLYYLEKISLFSVYLEETVKHHYMEDIHQLRVTLKRVNALFQLIDICTEGQFKARFHYQLFRPIFREAGYIREGQINLKCISRYTVPVKQRVWYAQFIGQQIGLYKEKLDSAIMSFSDLSYELNNDILRHICLHMPKQEVINHSKSFIRLKAEGIKELRENPKGEDDIHEIRIYLKSIDHIITLLKDTRSVVFKKRMLKTLDKTEDLIGDWHDNLIFIDSLMNFVSHWDPDWKMDREPVLQLIQTVEEENGSLLQKIDQQLNNTLDHILSIS